MNINIDPIATTAFVLKYRLKGYTLLQNPKGTNPNEVTMLKTWLGLKEGGMWGDCVDKCYHYHKIHRYKKGDNVINDKVYLETEYFMDPETKTYPKGRKNYDGFIIKNGERISIGKEKVKLNEANKRPIPDWQYDAFDFPIEKDKFKSKLFYQNKNRGYYLPRTGLMI